EDVLALSRRSLVEHRTGVRSKMHSTPRRGEMPYSPRNDRTPIRLTRRGRVVVVTFAAGVTLMSFWVTVGADALAGGHDGDMPSAPGETVIVHPGDTLWGIASEVDPETDTRLVVQRIIDLNGLG